ncbi:MAG: hypothetical protein GY851_03575 [bacterium]|nr:hypothetical protein [bacterium]
MKRTLCLALLALVMLPVCDDVPPPPPPVDAPDAPDPNRSPEEIATEILTGLSPLNVYMKDIAPEIPVDKGLQATLLARLREAKSTYEVTEQGKKALRMVVNDLEQRLEPMRAEERAGFVYVLCELVAVIDADNMRVRTHRAWAEREKNRPMVHIRAWFEELEAPVETIYVLLAVFLPDTGEVTHVEVRPGQEFGELKFVEIIGKKSGILLEYMPTGTRFEVYGS